MLVVRSRQPDEVRRQKQRFGRPFATVVADRARVLQRAVELAERALESGA
jgi:hypothetical protein